MYNPNHFIIFIKIYLFKIYLFIYLYIYLFIYLFIYLYMSRVLALGSVAFVYFGIQ